MMEAYGLDERLRGHAAAYPDLTPGRIVAQERGLYRAVFDCGERLAEVSGRLLHQAVSAVDTPCVGDFVMADTAPERAVIRAVLPRRSLLVRRAAGAGREAQGVAANVDTAFLCMSLNHNFNVRRLERYLAMAYDSGASPVVLLTKADLCADVRAALDSLPLAVREGAPVCVVSAAQEAGCQALLPYLAPGRTVAFIGSSGVGKSTLINRLLGEERLDTQAVGFGDRGRHTTTRRELFMLPGGAMVIDTPGMRELGLWDADDGLGRAFADIEALAAQCRFASCTHGSEPGCAVRRAITDGELDEERLLAFGKLRREAAYAADSREYLAAKERKFREISMINKASRRNRR
ncbi:MAG: ribosome small subunit-dependent GTPase A [Candidatus Ventricola sp.]